MTQAMLSPIQYLAVKHLACGESEESTAEKLQVSVGALRKWRKTSEEFKSELQKAVAQHGELVEAMLIAGERAAAETLMKALEATTRGEVPHWNVRVQAALSLLDRAGQRGRAVEKQQIAAITARAESPDVERALRNALRDPGVRAWLKDNGKELPALSALSSVEETTIEVDFEPENPESLPVSLNTPPDAEKVAS